MSTQEQSQSAAWRYIAPADMEAGQFEQWVDLLEERTGITLPVARKTFLITNLAIRMRELRIEDYQHYYELIVREPLGQIEWEVLVDRLTVHETRFYRDEHSLSYIRNKLLPSFIQHNPRPYTIQVWSVGCATGEEPYSLAMMLDQFVAQYDQGVYYGVTASDVSRAALQSARRGLYHKRRIKNVPEKMRRTYLQDVDCDHVQVQPSLTQRVCFLPINILQLDSQKVGQMDIIVCQNVLIYFKPERRRSVLNALVAFLKPGGVLMVGPGEAVGWTHPQMTASVTSSVCAYKRTVTQAQGS
ncbi:MAG: methyltransferase domain-containing protein [Gammaproteobacteria bacterium]|nr:methyltransferase domain-containing protein [Gammaproteobacteria bacterium]